MSVISISTTPHPSPWHARRYQTGSLVDQTGLVSQLSDLSVTYSLRSNISVPNIRRSAILSRTAERLHLISRREYEAGRGSRIAQCYHEKLLDVQRQQTGLQDWCRSHARVMVNNSHSPNTSRLDSLGQHSTQIDNHSTPIPRSRLLKPEPIRSDSSYITSTADLTAFFLDAADRDGQGPAQPQSLVNVQPQTSTHPEFNPWSVAVDNLTQPIDNKPLRRTSPLTEYPIENVHRQEPKSISPIPSSALNNDHTDQNHSYSPQIEPSDVNGEILERLSHIFPFHSSKALAEALVEASGNELSAIAALIKCKVHDPATFRLRRTQSSSLAISHNHRFQFAITLHDNLACFRSMLRWKFVKAKFHWSRGVGNK